MFAVRIAVIDRQMQRKFVVDSGRRPKEAFRWYYCGDIDQSFKNVWMTKEMCTFSLELLSNDLDYTGLPRLDEFIRAYGPSDIIWCGIELL